MEKTSAMKNIIIIGAGQIGSRHLQALRAIKTPLDISVVDTSQASLDIARQRYDEMPQGTVRHTLNFVNEFPPKDIDIAIISTSSNTRREATEKLLEKNKVKFIIFEKLLFQKIDDFSVIKKLLKKHKTRAWVNCSMRIMPFYGKIKEEFKDKKIFYHVDGGMFGLITNAIHYIDHMAYLTECNKYKINTELLDTHPFESKRKEFIEFNGTLKIEFSNGSLGIFTCYPNSPAPIVTSISGNDIRIISKESEGKAWISRKDLGWQWEDTDSKMPNQSQMTTDIVENLFKTETCKLTDFEESIKLHIPFLEAILKHLNAYSEKKYDYYPFT